MVTLAADSIHFFGEHYEVHQENLNQNIYSHTDGTMSHDSRRVKAKPCVRLVVVIDSYPTHIRSGFWFEMHNGTSYHPCGNIILLNIGVTIVIITTKRRCCADFTCCHSFLFASIRFSFGGILFNGNAQFSVISTKKLEDRTFFTWLPRSNRRAKSCVFMYLGTVFW